MREWHKPTVEETESGMEVTSYLRRSWIALNPSSFILGNCNGGPAEAWPPFAFGDLSALSPVVDWFPVQNFLMWHQPSFHEWVMTLSSRLTMLCSGRRSSRASRGGYSDL